jgi:hypothetical protein
LYLEVFHGTLRHIPYQADNASPGDWSSTAPLERSAAELQALSRVAEKALETLQVAEQLKTLLATAKLFEQADSVVP